jgi:uncharacterized protein (TIGR02147 family)
MRFQDLLSEELETRRRKNPSYSLRALARDAGISPGLLSGVLRSKRPLSEKRAYQIADRLGWPAPRAKLFGALLRLERASDEKRRSELTVEVAALSRSEASFRRLGIDTFHLISRWYHYAILEATFLDDFVASAEWISRRLGIALVDASAAIARLKRLRLLSDQNGRLRKTERHITTNDTPSLALRSFHLQMLEKAKLAIRNHPEPSRKISGVTMAIDPRRIPEANERVIRFRRELMEFLEGGDRTALYHLSIQLFRLDKEDARAMSG